MRDHRPTGWIDSSPAFSDMAGICATSYSSAIDGNVHERSKVELLTTALLMILPRCFRQPPCRREWRCSRRFGKPLPAMGRAAAATSTAKIDCFDY
jgi:hypothetical protein